MNHDTTPTPRTEAVHNLVAKISRCESDLRHERRLTNLSMELERELAEKTNEVARLEEELKERIETQNTFAMALLEIPEREVERLRDLLERLCDSVSENWDEGIANYFREEANK